MTSAEIIERLEKLDGPSREVDAVLFAIGEGGRVHFADPDEGVVIWEKPIDGMWIRRPIKISRIPKITASLDAAIALVEKMLPEQVVEIFKQALDDWCSDLATAKAADFPRFVLIAFFRAREGRDG